MHRRLFATFVLVLSGSAVAQAPSKPGTSAAPAPAAEEQKAPDGKAVLELLKADAGALRPLLASPLARSFLNAVGSLPEPTSHTVLRDKSRTHAYSEDESAKLDEEDRKTLTPRTFDPAFFYYTGYGSPLIYGRALDVLDHACPTSPTSLAGKKIMDFGCGTIAHLRMMAAMGADVHGVEIEPVFRVLYGQPGDQGEVASLNGAPAGRVVMHIGRWPAERDISRAVGGGYDLITSKNTLKRGYIHPARKTDPRFLVRLGVDDDTFLRQVHDALKPGGLFLIYNLSPAQNSVESGKPYLPHADGECPFKPEQLAAARLEVLEYDRDDRDKAVEIWMALGINEGKTAEETRKDLFAWYTLCRRSVADR
jgi:SAM-dependent methyltransferase